MEYIEAPHTYTGHLPKIFLAGGIGQCSDWQAKVVAALAYEDVALLNPRRASFDNPWTTANSREQITWEFNALQQADLILFWFDGGPSAQPIALFELGVYGTRGSQDKPVIIGRDPDYLRADDITIQIGLYAPGRRIHDTLDSVCQKVRDWLRYRSA